MVNESTKVEIDYMFLTNIIWNDSDISTKVEIDYMFLTVTDYYKIQ